MERSSILYESKQQPAVRLPMQTADSCASLHEYGLRMRPVQQHAHALFPLYAASAARLQYDAPYSSSACSLSGQLTPANACKPRFWATADFHRSWLHAAADSLWRWQCPPANACQSQLCPTANLCRSRRCLAANSWKLRKFFIRTADVSSCHAAILYPCSQP